VDFVTLVPAADPDALPDPEPPPPSVDVVSEPSFESLSDFDCESSSYFDSDKSSDSIVLLKLISRSSNPFSGLSTYPACKIPSLDAIVSL
jgi:hypothetical protein